MFLLICILITCLQVSNLFPKDELQEITQKLIPVMKKEFPLVPPTFDNLYQYFISRARKNLHVVLCFSPVGSNSAPLLPKQQHSLSFYSVSDIYFNFDLLSFCYTMSCICSVILQHEEH